MVFDLFMHDTCKTANAHHRDINNNKTANIKEKLRSLQRRLRRRVWTTIHNTQLKLQKWKKRSEATQTLRAGCSEAEPNIFAPPQTPFQGARDGQILNSWRWSLPLPTNPVWWGSMHAISSYRGNSPTKKQTHTHTHTNIQGQLQYTAQLSSQCN